MADPRSGPHPGPDPTTLLELATDLARRAGALALSMHSGLEGHDTKSTPTDIVTAADRACEQLLVDAVRTARPDDGILGEEGASCDGTSGVRWVVDPIDGTVNYLYGLPQWAVSIGVEVRGEALVGVVFDAAKDELWTAVRGQGAALNGRPLRCSAVEDLSQTLVATGFDYDVRRRSVQAQNLARVLPVVRDVRRLGAGSLDLCAVAAGRVDAYYEQGLHPWDMSAGLLIAEEAGARTGDLRGGPAAYRMVVASAPAVFDPLVDVLVGLDADHDPLAQPGDPLAQPGDPLAQPGDPLAQAGDPLQD
ncbi:MAG: inositol monophosphatase [Actinomycetota bacterium]|nr:inositol monophosphatase [Actinomycetota bacterium]